MVRRFRHLHVILDQLDHSADAIPVLCELLKGAGYAARAAVRVGILAVGDFPEPLVVAHFQVARVVIANTTRYAAIC